MGRRFDWPWPATGCECLFLQDAVKESWLVCRETPLGFVVLDVSHGSLACDPCPLSATLPFRNDSSLSRVLSCERTYDWGDKSDGGKESWHRAVACCGQTPVVTSILPEVFRSSCL